MNVVYHLLSIPELLVSVTQFGLAQPVKFPEKTELQLKFILCQGGRLNLESVKC